MTPDTPSFPLIPLDAAIAAINASTEIDGKKKAEPAWTEDEEGILQSVGIPVMR